MSGPSTRILLTSKGTVGRLGRAVLPEVISGQREAHFETDRSTRWGIHGSGASLARDQAQHTIVAWTFRQNKRIVCLTEIRGAFHLINDTEAGAFQKSPGIP
jgi:hypothetical protein